MQCYKYYILYSVYKPRDTPAVLNINATMKDAYYAPKISSDSIMVNCFIETVIL